MVALRDLTRLQMGIETTAGTAVAATRRIPFTEGSYTPTVERKVLDEVRGVLAEYDDVVVRRGSELELTQELDYENILGPLLCSLANVTATGANAPYTWTFTPGRTAPTALATATWEVVESDGTNNVFSQNFALGRPTSLSFAIESETAQMSTTWMGRAATDLASPATPAERSRTIIPAALFGVWVDDDWASIGTTQAGVVRSANIEIDPGLVAAYYLAARSNLDMSSWYRGRILGSVSLVIDHDNTFGAGELGHWRNGDLRMVRLSATQGTGAALKALTIDMSVRYIESPNVLSRDEQQQTLELTGQLRADGTAAQNLLSIVVQNAANTF